MPVLCEGFAQHGVEMSERVLTTDDDPGADAERVEHTGELASDVAAADQRDARGQTFEVEELVRSDPELRAGQRGHVRATSGGEQEVRSGEPLPSTSTVPLSTTFPLPRTTCTPSRSRLSV